MFLKIPINFWKFIKSFQPHSFNPKKFSFVFAHIISKTETFKCIFCHDIAMTERVEINFKSKNYLLMCMVFMMPHHLFVSESSPINLNSLYHTPIVALGKFLIAIEVVVYVKVEHTILNGAKHGCEQLDYSWGWL